MVYNGYYKVMSNIPKMGHLPIPDLNAMISPIILKFLFVVKFPNIAIDPHRSHIVDATIKNPLNLSLNIYNVVPPSYKRGL